MSSSISEEDGHGVPDRKDGRQYWRYSFAKFGQYLPVYFYDFSEEGARKQYAAEYGVEPGVLIERTPW